MRTLIYLALIIIAIAFTAFIIAMIMYCIDEKNPDSDWLEKLDEEYNSKQITKCIEAQKTGVCPHACNKCSWNLRSTNGIIEMRRKP